MKSAYWLVLAAVLTAPVSAADLQGSQGPDAAASGSAAPSTAAVTPVTPDNQIICKTFEPPTGSRIGGSTRVCKTKRQWDESVEDKRGKFGFELQNAGRSLTPSSGPSN